MAFFDKLSKTVTEVSQKTIAKTKEMADTVKLNSMISEEEKNIANQYCQIGKLYASLHREDYEEDFASMISAISVAEAKIKNCKSQIQEIKGVQYCENCGAEVPKGLAFCTSCGAKMPEPPPQLQESVDCVKCENCGADVKKGMRFCTSCGKLMEEGAVAPATEEPTVEGQAVEAPVEEAPVVEESQEKTCPNCGTKAEVGMAFCTECGTKL